MRDCWSAVSSAVMVYGIALVFGAAGTMQFAAIAERFKDSDSDLQQKIDYMAKAIAESP